MKIVYMGTPDFAVPVLEKLVEKGHELGYAVTQPDRARSRNKVTFSPVKEAALQLGIQVLQPEKLSADADCLQAIRAYSPDAIVVVAYGQILKKDLLELPRYGCFNVHGSLLPRWRGAAPMQHAILAGDEKTGVTIMRMEEGLDTGDMIAKAETIIGDKNFESIHDELAAMGADLMTEALESIERGKADFVPQNDQDATYAHKISKQDGKIDFGAGAEAVLRKIRAFDPWPGAFCEMEGKTVKLWDGFVTGDSTEAVDGTILSVDKASFSVAAGGSVLAITQLQMPGKKRVKTADFLRGHSLAAGMVLS